MEYMAANHRYVTVNDLADAHADHIKFQRDSGGNAAPFLASLKLKTIGDSKSAS